ncbi:MAG: hypothetical protein IJT07_05585 [Oscillospiraceae bacterium]|nr:hypothetical protein [Oscillospiraceae bacterium]
MPLHLDAITKDSQNPALVKQLLEISNSIMDSFFITEDKKYQHMQKVIIDTLTMQAIGKIVITTKETENVSSLELIDADIMFDACMPTTVCFVEMIDGSSDANEYYEIATESMDQHLIIETVNRHTIPNDILGESRDVYASIFPFELTVYESIDTYNRQFTLPVNGINGFSDTFTMFTPGSEGHPSYTHLFGTVKSFRDVQIQFGSIPIRFVLAQVHTALGLTPVAMSRDVFDLTQLRVGCLLTMSADVKLDLADPTIFTNIHSEKD